MFFTLFLFSFQPLIASEIVENAPFNEALKEVTENGRIHSEKMKQKKFLLSEYLASYKKIRGSDLEHYTREEQLAFWINGYNAVMLQSLSEHASQGTLELEDCSFTLEQLRDRVLRRRYRDERIHFALAGPFANGPALRGMAFTGKDLDGELDAAIRKFISDPHKNRIQPGRKFIELSFIFKDFGEDFLLNYGALENSHKKFSLTEMAVLSFIAQHVSPDEVSYLSDARYKIVYLPREVSQKTGN
ncbi:MAG: DUF547 domain-containing protein [Candidatus Omnitrophica bacterium]|nr:DUF547 domain-containing protein [Candidatus Omnitrophota bacterium]